ncbi:hypothetical protein MPTK1_7g02260 [Marchantia polymorpha subsp. ruderalis]|uniref:Uncharacterized protein n=2 Tax=Marchantia polymorpha TaxID=3197 RepID=A0AAF6BVC3_MARPO|nr:hypothetical protein MARPO_0088s0061 [Marchantia polymorpha]PTQ33516.1 hypothetical protein MARPO_0088s0061 [Marchantia polymorpha]BBN15956.1 hypothetical protein Mp_7g02260 [Marchantia polymorpha subsp. ruderalis]BBN15957.1 hypothetical protein Mp_7g02260 [Marchantia polymorpha subsp. ruderalis]|eukprot:PTQ33515.1 hypothetical protein MARPO_0088s0061 [Marchantia polymorpha]
MHVLPHPVDFSTLHQKPRRMFLTGTVTRACGNFLLTMTSEDNEDRVSLINRPGVSAICGLENMR